MQAAENYAVKRQIVGNEPNQFFLSINKEMKKKCKKKNKEKKREQSKKKKKKKT